MGIDRTFSTFLLFVRRLDLTSSLRFRINRHHISHTDCQFFPRIYRQQSHFSRCVVEELAILEFCAKTFFKKSSKICCYFFRRKMISLNELTPDLVCNNLPETLATLKDDAVWREIPLISSLRSYDHLKEMQLVRFRGLVQDMRDPEIYLEAFQTKSVENGDVKLRSLKYRDNIKLEVIYPLRLLFVLVLIDV